jgi:hypothetical protein
MTRMTALLRRGLGRSAWLAASMAMLAAAALAAWGLPYPHG